MHDLAFSFGALTVALCITAWQAWRLGNEQRDVALLGAAAGTCGAGTVLAATL